MLRGQPCSSTVVWAPGSCSAEQFGELSREGLGLVGEEAHRLVVLVIVRELLWG